MSKSGLGLSQSSGFTIVADKLNYLRFLSHFRSVHRGAYFTEIRTTTIRKLYQNLGVSYVPYILQMDRHAGLLNHLASECKIVVAKTREVDLNLVRKAVKENLGLNFEVSVDLCQKDLQNLLPVLVDGLFIGSLHERDAVEML